MALFKKLKADTAESNAIVNDQTNAKVNQELKANDSKGGFAGYFASGGDTRGTDTMLARVDPHEFIMNAQASARFKSQLTAMNQGHDPGSRGGATIPTSATSTSTSTVVARVRPPSTRSLPASSEASGRGQSDSGDNMFIQVMPFRRKGNREDGAPTGSGRQPRALRPRPLRAAPREARSWSPRPWPSTPSTTLPRTRSWTGSSTTDCGVTPTTSGSSTLRLLCLQCDRRDRSHAGWVSSRTTRSVAAGRSGQPGATVQPPRRPSRTAPPGVFDFTGSGSV